MNTSRLRSIGLITIGILIGSFFMVTMDWVPQTSASVFGTDGNVLLGKKNYDPKSYEALPDPSPRFQAISKDIIPTVVYIEVEGTSPQQKNPYHNDEFFKKFFPDYPDGQNGKAPKMRGSGSGFIVSDDGYIMTNNHVVESADKNGITVRLNDKREFKAKLIGRDPTTDLAVIKIDGTNLPVAPLGDSEQADVGQWVLAVGNPLSLTSTVTAGIISAIGRNIGIIQNSYNIESFIQTDAAINPGNSGGPLVDMTGAVIGINSAIASTNGRYEGYGFAVPINLAKKVATDLIKNGKVQRGVLGVRMQDIDATMSKALGLDAGKGVLVSDVLKNSAAEKAGIKAKDVIINVDGHDVSAGNQISALVGLKRPGDNVKVVVSRNGSEKTFTVSLGNLADMDETFASNDQGQPDADSNSPVSLSVEKLGVEVRSISKEEKKQYDAENGVVVESVTGDAENLVKGLVITEIDRQEISTPSDVEKALKNKKTGDAVLLKVKSPDKNSAYIAVNIN